MPEIPQLGQTNRLEYTSPVQIASVEQAGFTGQQIQRTGAAVMEFGQDVADVQNRKSAAKRNLDAATASQEARQAAISVKDEVLKDPNIHPGDFTKAFSEKYEKAVAPIRKRHQESDPLVSQAVGNSILDIQNDFNADLSHLGRVEASAEMVNQVKSLSSRGSAIAYKDPSQIDKEIINFDKTLVELSKTGFYDAKTALKVRSEGPSEIVQGGIYGRITENDFAQARNLLNRYSPYLDVEKVKTISREIGAAEYQNELRKQAAIDRRTKTDEKHIKDTQEKNFTNISKIFLGVRNPQEEAAAQKKALELFTNRDISKVQYDSLKVVRKDATGVDDENIRYDVHYKLSTGQSTSELRRMVNQKVMSKTVSPEEGAKLQDAIRIQEEKDKSDPGAVQERSQAYKLLDANFLVSTSKYFPNFYTQAQKDARARAGFKMLYYVDKGMSYEKAANRVVNEYKGVQPPLVDGMEVSRQQKVEALKKEFKIKYSDPYFNKTDKSMNKQKYLKARDQFLERLRYLEKVQEEKSLRQGKEK